MFRRLSTHQPMIDRIVKYRHSSRGYIPGKEQVNLGVLFRGQDALDGHVDYAEHEDKDYDYSTEDLDLKGSFEFGSNTEKW